MQLIDWVIHATHLLVIGTSLYSEPVGSLPSIAREAGRKVIILNQNADIEVPAVLRELVIK